MAVVSDNSLKRASSIGILLTWILSPLFPDGADSDGDRSHSVNNYNGSSVVSPEPIDEIIGSDEVAMANAVSVCSNALVKLGDDPITSLLDNTNRARHCNRLFEPTRKAVLRDGVWNDSLKRARLAQLSNTPVWGYGYAYALPSDFMRLVKTSLDDVDMPYKIEGRSLLTDAGEVNVLYVYNNTNVGSYDSLHADALTVRLAFELCEAITGKKSRGDTLWAEWLQKVAVAKVVDGQEDYQDSYIDDTLTLFRA